MEIKEKLLMVSLLLLIARVPLGSGRKASRLVFGYRKPQISCRYLRHVYKNQWFQPQCRPDGGMKNPQCFYPGYELRICCCTFTNPLVGRTIKWIGQCAKYKAKSTTKPLCRGPRMLNKSDNTMSKEEEDKTEEKEKKEAEERKGKEEEVKRN